MKLLLCALLWPVAFLGSSGAAPLSESMDRLAHSSDLIVVATITTTPYGSSGSAPIGNYPSKAYAQSVISRVEVEKVLRGQTPENPTPLIEARLPVVTTYISSLSSAQVINQPIFAISEAPEPLRNGTLQPLSEGSKWIIFLQDRRMRAELGQTSSNGEEVRYIAFDPFLSLFPYSEALELELLKP